NENERLLREGVDIVGHALVRIVDLGPRNQLVVVSVPEVAAHELIRQPPPPIQRQVVAYVVVVRVDRDAEHQESEKYEDRAPETRGVARRQRRREFAGLPIEQYGESGVADEEQNQQQEQQTCLPFLDRKPVRPGEPEGAPEKFQVNVVCWTTLW